MAQKINVSHVNNLLPFLNYFEKKGIAWKSTAQQYQFPEDILQGDYWLPSHQVMGFLNAMMRNSKQAIGLEVGRLITLEQISPLLATEIKQCLSLEEALHRIIDLIASLNNHVIIWPEKIAGKWYLCHRGAYHPSLPSYDQAEWFRSFALLSLCRQFLGGKWQPKTVFMSFSQHLAKNLPQSFAATHFTFNHAFGAIEVPLSEDFEAIAVNKKNSDWQQSINALIDTYATLPWFNIDWLARFAGSSSRTLQRRFNVQGNNFRELRDRARCKKAQLLLNEQCPPYEVAWQCGYSDLSNFNRAFKNWTQKTPAQYQRNLLL